MSIILKINNNKVFPHVHCPPKNLDLKGTCKPRNISMKKWFCTLCCYSMARTTMYSHKRSKGHSINANQKVHCESCDKYFGVRYFASHLNTMTHRKNTNN